MLAMHTRLSQPTHEKEAGVSVFAELSPSDDIYTVDDLIVSRSRDQDQTPLVAFPKSETTLTEFDHFTGKDLDSLAGRIAARLIELGLSPTTSSSVVALLAQSDLAYLGIILGLTRLGYTVLLLSTRLALPAYLALLDQTCAQCIAVAPFFASVVHEIQEKRDVKSITIPSRADFDWTSPEAPYYKAPENTSAAAAKPSFIVHSSGSTGLPKPIFQTHGPCLANYSNGFRLRGFITLPLYHNHGLSCLFRAIYSRNEITFFNSAFPLTGPNLAETMERVKPQIMFGVPYAIKLLGESERGIKALALCEVVLFGGSSCPDEIGDKLVEQGVNLVAHYGSTEIGQIMTSTRPAGDKAWNYYRMLPEARPHVLMDEIEPGTYECVGLQGLKAKTTTNSDDPPNSFRTRDVFSKHPTIDGWKYIGRLDDRVTLMNGEKVLPLSIEGCIREDALVAEAVVFGIGKALPGLLAFRSDIAAELSDEEFIAKIWPAVQTANARAEAFSRIDKELIVPFPAGTDYPRTDKGTFIRARVYKEFSEQIEATYKAYEGSAGGSLVLNLEELEEWLMRKFEEQVNVKLASATTDFYTAGVDSLQAIKMYGLIKRTLSLGDNTSKLTQNAVFEQQNVRQLAKFLYALCTGADVLEDDQLAVMKELVPKYSNFAPRAKITAPEPISHVMIITGTTGSLGAHVLAQALRRENVSEVICLVRAASPSVAKERVLSALQDRSLDLSTAEQTKITALPSDFSKPDLGLEQSILESMRNKVSCIVHSAWAVNFNLGVRSFEEQHIKGAYNLINFSLSVHTPQPARFYFCSSVSAGAGIVPATIRETSIADFEHSQNMGYARSKLVTEHITLNAANAGALTRVLRIGQIVGDSNIGLWNDTEAIPLLIRSAITTGCLPTLDENPSWLPVDILASCILEVTGITAKADMSDPQLVYHLLNPRNFSWNNDLLPALHAAKLCDFETVDQREWIRRLRASEQDPVKNPSIKLLGFFAEKYDNDEPGRKGLVFETKQTEAHCRLLKGGIDVISEGFVNKFVESWLKRWT